MHILHSLLVPKTLSFDSFFVEERFDTYPSCFGTEMAAEGICTSEPATAAPLSALLQLSFANKFFLSGVQSFVTFSIVLTSKCFPTYSTNEGTFVGVSTQVRAKVVCSSETLWTKRALECCGMFLNSFGIASFGGCTLVVGIS